MCSVEDVELDADEGRSRSNQIESVSPGRGGRREQMMAQLQEQTARRGSLHTIMSLGRRGMSSIA